MTENDEEKDNHFEENQSDNSLKGNKKNVGLKPNLQVFYFLLIIPIFICLQCYAQNLPSLNLDYKIKYLPKFIDQRDHVRTEVTILDKDNILFLGGLKNSESLKSTEIYNIKTNKFIKMSDMNIARSSPSTLLLHNGNVLIIGGTKYPEKTQVKEVELFDVKNNKFYTIATIPEYLFYHINIYQAKNSNKIVCFCCDPSHIWYFDLDKKEFIKSKNFGWNNDLHYGVYSFIKDKIYVFPRSVTKKQSFPIYELDINTDTMKKIETDLLLGLNSRHYQLMPVNVNDSEIIFFGSFGGLSNLWDTKDIISYNIKTQKAKIVSNLITERTHTKAININKNSILIFGGSHGLSENKKIVKYTELFDIDKKTTKKIRNLQLKEECRYEYISENNILSFCGNKASILNFKK